MRMLAPALALYLFLCLPHIGDGFGGFHGAANEAHYAQLAKSFADDPFSNPKDIMGREDFNIPPLTTYLVGVSFMAFGAHEAAGRMVMILFGAAAIICTYLVAKRWFGGQTAGIAALILSAMPMQVMLSRNLQADMPYVALGLLSVWLYLEGRKLPAGIALGLALLAKQQAALFALGIAALHLVRGRPVKGLFPLAGIAALVYIPYPLYNAIAHPAGFFAGQSSRMALAFSEEGARHGLSMVGLEVYWGLSPAAAIAFIGGLALALRRKKEGELEAAGFALGFIAFFIAYNKHGYYILGLAPFAAMACASALSAIGDRRVRAAAIILLVLSMAFYSAVMVSAKKYGFDHFRQLPKRHGPGPAQIVIGKAIWENSAQAIGFYDPDATVVYSERVGSGPDGLLPLNYSTPTYSLIHASEVDLAAMPQVPRAIFASKAVMREEYSLVLFGFAFKQPDFNRHFFSLAPISIERVGGPLDTGYIVTGRVPELYMMPVARHQGIYRAQQGGYSVRDRDYKG